MLSLEPEGKCFKTLTIERIKPSEFLPYFRRSTQCPHCSLQEDREESLKSGAQLSRSTLWNLWPVEEIENVSLRQQRTDIIQFNSFVVGSNLTLVNSLFNPQKSIQFRKTFTFGIALR